MGVIRLALIALSLFGAAFAIYILNTEAYTTGQKASSISVAIFCAVNAAYLWRSGLQGVTSGLGTLWLTWIAARQAELERRKRAAESDLRRP